MKRALNTQQTPHTSPTQRNYGVSSLRNLEKIQRVITSPCCIFDADTSAPRSNPNSLIHTQGAWYCWGQMVPIFSEAQLLSRSMWCISNGKTSCHIYIYMYIFEYIFCFHNVLFCFVVGSFVKLVLIFDNFLFQIDLFPTAITHFMRSVAFEIQVYLLRKKYSNMKYVIRFLHLSCVNRKVAFQLQIHHICQ